DRSDGGLFVTLAEMAFAGRVGLEIDLPEASPLETLFSEELGALVQVPNENTAAILNQLHDVGLSANLIGHTTTTNDLTFRHADNVIYSNARTTLHKMWSETSFHI